MNPEKRKYLKRFLKLCGFFAATFLLCSLYFRTQDFWSIFLAAISGAAIWEWGFKG